MDDSTRRITQQKQTLDEAYSPPGKHPHQILKHINKNTSNSPPGEHPLQILKHIKNILKSPPGKHPHFLPK